MKIYTHIGIIILIVICFIGADWKDVANQAYQDSQTSGKVKIDSKEAYVNDHAGSGGSVAEEGGALQGILSQSQEAINKMEELIIPSVTIPEELETSESNMEVESEGDSFPIYGTWQRHVVIPDETLAAPATLTINSKSFFSSGPMGTAQGTVSNVTESSMTMTMTHTTCPINYPLPLTVTYTYTIEDEGTKLTTVTSGVAEIYTRIK